MAQIKYWIFLILLLATLASCERLDTINNYNVFCRKVTIDGQVLLRTGYLNDDECCGIENTFLRVTDTTIDQVYKFDSLWFIPIGKYAYNIGNYRVYKWEGYSKTDLLLFVKGGLIDGIALKRWNDIFLRYYTKECRNLLRRETTFETYLFEEHGSLDFDQFNHRNCEDSSQNITCFFGEIFNSPFKTRSKDSTDLISQKLMPWKRNRMQRWFY